MTDTMTSTHGVSLTDAAAATSMVSRSSSTR